MKTIASVLTFWALFWWGTGGFAQQETQQTSVVELHFQLFYLGVPVVAKIDSQIVFSRDNLQNMPSKSFAAIEPVNVTKGQHLLQITIDSTRTDTLLDIPAKLFVGIRYDPRTEQIKLQVQQSRFVYF